MNKHLMKLAGFSREVELVEQGKCPHCEKKVDTKEFDSALGLAEFEISGMCKKCQDTIFG